MSAYRNPALGGPVTSFVSDCGDSIACILDGVFDAIDPLAQALHDLFSVHAVTGAAVSTADLAPLQPVVFEVLDRRPEFASAGFAFAPCALADRERHLDWWHRVPAVGYEPVLVDVDPSAPNRYDYVALDWYAGAVRNAGRYAHGPIVDETQGHSYILTFALPVVVDERLVGVVGTDVSMSRLEHVLIRPLRRIAAEAVLVNDDRRVVASNCATWTTGEKLRTHPNLDRASWQISVPVTGDLGWSLSVHRPGQRARQAVGSSVRESR